MFKKLNLKRPTFLTKNILILSLVSFFTDIASEMLFPVMPLYLKEIGYGVLAIGMLEGSAELIAGIIKLYSGKISDRLHKRTVFVKIGYTISALAKPAIGFITSIWAIFGLRFADRIGKGIRVAPRDALLADESSPETRGRVFGFHRSMDSLGAMVGPIISLGFLLVYTDYKKLFAFAFIPGVIAIALTLILRDKKDIKNNTESLPEKTIQTTNTESPAAAPRMKFRNFYKTSSKQYKKMLAGFFAFALINSSNVFLLLRARELGMPDKYILGAYIIYNFVYAAASYPAGSLADKYGFKNIYIVGVFIFACVYGIFGTASLSIPLMFIIFAIYGLFSAIDDGTTKAWLSLHIEKSQTATGLGLHMLLSSIGFFIASFITGILWQKIGGQNTFVILSLLALGAMTFFMFLPNQKAEQRLRTERAQRYGR